MSGTYRPAKTRELQAALVKAGFERVRAGGNKHTIYSHPCGVKIALPEYGRTCSPGVSRQVWVAIDLVKEREGQAV